MSMNSGSGGAKGRQYDQITRDGTSSAGTMGTGATGDIGEMPAHGDSRRRAQGGNLQAGRTDDLLAGGSDAECEDEGFLTDGKQGMLGTGMGQVGSGSCGNRQSGELNRQEGGERAASMGRDAGNSGNGR